ncbi:hypothetical protein Droror1_Dr00014065 [Drosera rotundifolia]
MNHCALYSTGGEFLSFLSSDVTSPDSPLRFLLFPNPNLPALPLFQAKTLSGANPPSNLFWQPLFSFSLITTLGFLFSFSSSNPRVSLLLRLVRVEVWDALERSGPRGD